LDEGNCEASSMLLHDYLKKQALERPQKVALIVGPEKLTYGHLDSKSSRLASVFEDRGVTRGDRIALFLPNSEEMVLGIYGALKCDAAFLPLSPTIKLEKLTAILNDCRPAGLMMGKAPSVDPVALAQAVPSLKVVLLCNQEDPLPDGRFLSLSDALARESLTPRPSRNIDLDLAYVIYTSGSTGIPKGVMMTHGSVLSAATSIISYLGSTPDEIVLNCLPLPFVYGLYQVLMSVMVGGTVVLEKGFNYPQRTMARLRESKVTGLPVVPTMAVMLLDLEAFNGKEIPSLRYITSAGAQWPVEHIEELQSRFPSTQIFSMYGLTECKRVSYLPPEQISIRPSSVGKGMPNEEVWVADEKGAPVPPGEVGELVVRGSNVMLGYWERPEETAKVLRPGRYPGERVLYTGDFFKTDSEGYLYFVGRKDDMIKTRGERVSPAEVEKVLVRMPGIKEAAVVGIPDRLLGQAIAAYVVPGSDAGLDPQSVKRFAAERLEDFAVPKVVEIVSSLPYTSSGKIDKKLLAGDWTDNDCLNDPSAPHKSFSKDILTIDCPRAVRQIGDFIRTSVVRGFKRRGAVVGLSGGVDSSVVAVLARQALGRDRVLGLILPERETDPLSERLARDLAAQFDIPIQVVDLTESCGSFDLYERRDEIVRKNFPDYDPAVHRYKLILPGDLLEGSALNVYRLALISKDGTSKTKRLSKEDLLGLISATTIKQRLRMVTLYYYAERENYVVIGTTNKTELDLGFFVRYGDGGVDMEPLASYYKVQVYQIATHLGIPDEIIQRPPTADVYPAMSEDREFYFRLSYEDLDPLLYAWEHHIPIEEVMQEMNLQEEQVRRIYRDFATKRILSEHLQRPPINLGEEFVV